MGIQFVGDAPGKARRLSSRGVDAASVSALRPGPGRTAATAGERRGRAAQGGTAARERGSARGREQAALDPQDWPGTLGEEMRGRRATLGLSLAEVRQELRIGESILDAIECADLDGFPNPGAVSGYIRCYARRLGMDPARAYRRFCRETGFVSPAALAPACEVRARGGRRVAFNNRTGTELTTSRFAVCPGGRGQGAGASLGAIAYALALVALLAGLLYGAGVVLEDIQQVPRVALADSPPMTAEVRSASGTEAAGAATAASSGAGLAALAGMPARSLPPRDGPMIALDPLEGGLFARADGAGRRDGDSGVRVAGVGRGRVAAARAGNVPTLAPFEVRAVASGF